MMLRCVHALLLATANTELDVNSRSGVATPPDASEAASPAPLPVEILTSAERGELQAVVKWLRKGGAVDALGSALTEDGRVSNFTLLSAAAAYGHLEMVRELLKRGASVDLLANLGTTTTALMGAAANGHLSTLLLLLQHSANPDLPNIEGHTALMLAAGRGQEACVQALLRAEANTELLDKREGRTALQHAEGKGHTAIAELIRQHAAPPQSTVSAATSPDAVEPAAWPAASLPAHIVQSARRGELQTVADGGLGLGFIPVLSRMIRLIMMIGLPMLWLARLALLGREQARRQVQSKRSSRRSGLTRRQTVLPPQATSRARRRQQLRPSHRPPPRHGPSSRLQGGRRRRCGRPSQAVGCMRWRRRSRRRHSRCGRAAWARREGAGPVRQANTGGAAGGRARGNGRGCGRGGEAGGGGTDA